MSIRYRIICPKCSVDIPISDPPTQNCPACGEPITEDTEVTFHPGGYNKPVRIIALIILLALVVISVLALFAVYL